MSRNIIPDSLFQRPQQYTADELVADPEKLRQAAYQVKLEARASAMIQANALMTAGWMFELPSLNDSEPWQWYWRSPPKGKRTVGRKYLSTNQAYNALMREPQPESETTP
jgi:hypothetical protein